MDWNNVDLNSEYERTRNILEPYSFDDLLLELTCNIKTENLTVSKIREQFYESLESKIQCAKEVFESNVVNIRDFELKYREENQ